MNANFVVVYVLRHPETGEVAFVGACTNPVGNLRKQVFDSKRGRIGPLYDWIRTLRGSHLRPSVYPIRGVPKYTVKSEIEVVKLALNYVDPPKRPRGPALKSPRDLRRFTVMDPSEFHLPGQARSTPDTRSKYVKWLKAALRMYGPKLKSIRHSKLVIPPNTLEQEALSNKLRAMILKDKTCLRPKRTRRIRPRSPRSSAPRGTKTSVSGSHPPAKAGSPHPEI